MNTLQNALKTAFPKQLEQIEKDRRKQRFEQAASRGRQLLDRASQLVLAGNPGSALRKVREDRYACACALAKDGRKTIKKGFAELEEMEQHLSLAAESLQAAQLQVVA